MATKKIKLTEDNKYYINRRMDVDSQKKLIFDTVKGEPIEKYVKDKELLKIIKGRDIFIAYDKRGTHQKYTISEGITGSCLGKCLKLTTKFVEATLFVILGCKKRRDLIKAVDDVIEKYDQVTPRWEFPNLIIDINKKERKGNERKTKQ